MAITNYQDERADIDIRYKFAFKFDYSRICGFVGCSVFFFLYFSNIVLRFKSDLFDSRFRVPSNLFEINGQSAFLQ